MEVRRITVEYRYLGKTGLKISRISLGTQTFGWTTDKNEAFRMLDYYVAAGGNYLDSADSYNNGVSEEILGEWLKARNNAQNLLIGTKVFFNEHAGPDSNDIGHSRKHIVTSLERSLKRLGIEAVDLYQLHCYDRGTDIELVMQIMEDLIRAGKILHYGISNFTPSLIMKMLMLAQYKHYQQPVSLQLEYSLLVRSPEWELLPLCEEEHIGTLAWSPLAGGWLTGKYRKNAPPPKNSRVGRRDREYDQPDKRDGERTWLIIDELERIANQRNVPVSQVALNWMRKKKSISSILIGARSMEQLESNMACILWEMSDEETLVLDKVSKEKIPYPYSFINSYSRESYL
jgi:aryl-alcohol dehydrogenase-like predicted oxidoreductase